MRRCTTDSLAFGRALVPVLVLGLCSLHWSSSFLRNDNEREDQRDGRNGFLTNFVDLLVSIEIDGKTFVLRLDRQS